MPKPKLPPGQAANVSVTIRLTPHDAAALAALVKLDNDTAAEQGLSAVATTTTVIRKLIANAASARGILAEAEEPQRRAAPLPVVVVPPAPAPQLAAPVAVVAPALEEPTEGQAGADDEHQEETDDGLDTATDAALKTRAYDLCQQHGKGGQAAFARACGSDKRMLTEWFSGRRPCPAAYRDAVIRTLRAYTKRIEA